MHIEPTDMDDRKEDFEHVVSAPNSGILDVFSENESVTPPSSPANLTISEAREYKPTTLHSFKHHTNQDSKQQRPSYASVASGKQKTSSGPKKHKRLRV